MAVHSNDQSNARNRPDVIALMAGDRDVRNVIRFLIT